MHLNEYIQAYSIGSVFSAACSILRKKKEVVTFSLFVH